MALKYSFRLIIVVLLGLIVNPFVAQDDMEDMLDDMEEDEIIYTAATFKGTRVINLHSIETVGQYDLEFRISHRFGSLSGGAYEAFGLDQSTIRLGFEYGLYDWCTIGIGRSTYEKTGDGFVKFKLLRQSKGKRTMPVSVNFLSGIYLNGLRWEFPDRENFFSSRLAYAHQLIIARKFTSALSLQVSPTIIHKNLVPAAADPNTTFAIGGAGRIKLTHHLALTAEYIYRIPPSSDSPEFNKYVNSLSAGIVIETGGHVFQLQFTNSLAMIEKGFVTETVETWSQTGIHFGFNISREFALKH